MATSALDYTFSKYERLSKKADIESVFSENRSFVVYPYKFLYSKAQQSFTSILFTVPKRSFKKAVDRNEIKRQLKDVYRHHKLNNNLNVAVIFLSKEKIPFNLLKNKLILGLERLSKEINQNL